MINDFFVAVISYIIYLIIFRTALTPKRKLGDGMIIYLSGALPLGTFLFFPPDFAFALLWVLPLVASFIPLWIETIDSRQKIPVMVITVLISGLSLYAANFSLSAISSSGYLLTYLVFLLLLTFSGMVFILIWLRLMRHFAYSWKNLFLFCLPLGQIGYYMVDVLQQITTGNTASQISIISIFMAIIANILFLRALLSHTEKPLLKEKMNMVENFYQKFAKDKETVLEKYSHHTLQYESFLREIDQVKLHVIQREKGQARELMDAMEKRMYTQSQYYSQNSIINAVLIEKGAQCLQSSIVLQSSIDIGEICAIKPLHLCSIFANLLDNAISANRNLPQDERYVNITAQTKGAYIHIKCTNPVGRIAKKCRSNSGYGHRILEDIAKIYMGVFQANSKNNVYTAVLSLELPA